jgi:urea carboxylase
MAQELEQSIATLESTLPALPAPQREAPVRLERAARAPGLVCRADGDRNLLIEYGPNALDLNLRFRVHALEQSLRAQQLPGIIDITPGIRSLQLHYDGAALPREALLEAIEAADAAIPAADQGAIPSRIVHLPLSWDDPATRLAIDRYMQTVRADAPWCPSNIEFIRRINGLASIDDVYRTVFDGSYLVLGLGDVYLGAPVATPLDPRHRLVTTKYNPARTWTPENAVGIGGAYLCVYGMEGPGGYQFVGRTIQMWNTWRETPDFRAGQPWLLNFFDQIRFYPVSAKELTELREDFPQGRFTLRTETTEFSLGKYRQFLAEIENDSSAFLNSRQAAFEAERERWAATPAALPPAEEARSSLSLNGDAPRPGSLAVRAPVSANVYNLVAQQGQRVAAGDQLVILEAMKMEVIVVAPNDGVVEEFHCQPGSAVESGQPLVYVKVAV